MNERLPAPTARDVIRAFERAGFTVSRTSGSHCRLIHAADFESEEEFSYEPEDCEGDLVLTWNEIFSAASPSMFDEASDDDFRSALNELVDRKALPSLREQDEFKKSTLSNFVFRQTYFQQSESSIAGFGLNHKERKKPKRQGHPDLLDLNTVWRHDNDATACTSEIYARRDQYCLGSYSITVEIYP